MRKYIVAALFAAGLATPAFAQDTGATFSGVRVEGLGGYESAKVEGDSADGIVYGGAVGFDIQSGTMVFGVEGEFTDTNIDECVKGVTIATDTLCAEFGRDLFAGGRIGAVIGGSTLAYVKGGYTNARVALDYEDGTAGTTADFKLGENLDGVRVGAGLEFAIGANTYAKAEYRYSNYEQGFEKHQGLVGFGFRF
jgi:outer membrane immunogenic protein